MGGKSSGWLSDCSLMVDEYKYVSEKVRNGLVEEAVSTEKKTGIGLDF